MNTDESTITSATISIRAILEAYACEEDLTRERIDEILDDARGAYKALMLAQGFQPEKEYQ